MGTLSQKHCIPCEGGAPPLEGEKLNEYLIQAPGWQVSDDNNSPSYKTSAKQRKIRREFKFKDFKEAMIFVGKVADIAESEGHHPDIYISYNKVRIELWTHSIDGLSENDFILASKIDNL